MNRKARNLCLIALVSFWGCKAQKHTDVYGWVIFENISRDSLGKVKETPLWKPPLKISSPPLDTFVFFKDNDSIRMISRAVMPYDMQLFRKVATNSSWKPKARIGPDSSF
jgi:hypothetical protein